MRSISIIIPCFNTDPIFLRQCFKSIVDQNYSDYEVIVIDDCSTNAETISFLNEASLFKNFKIIFSKNNVGPGQSRNIGILKAKNEIITFVDSDDYLYPEALKIINEKFEQNPILDFVSFGNDILSEDGEISCLYASYFNTGVTDINKFPAAITNRICCWSKAYRRLFLINNNVLFRKEDLYLEDLYFFILVNARAKNFMLCKEKIYVLRTTPNSRTTTPITMQKMRDILKVNQNSYYAIKGCNNYVERKFCALFNMFFYGQLKHHKADMLFKNDQDFRQLLIEAKAFITEVQSINMKKFGEK